jgi:L-cysteine S-thiosulfotransferase
VLAGCGPSPDSALGFRLPDGDADRGLAAYIELRCYACHVIDGLELDERGPGAIEVTLGGEVTRVRTYGELVTSIINPSHRLAPEYAPEDISINDESIMALVYLNDVLTVQQLIDLVALLQANYRVTPPEYDPYWYAYP